MQNSSKSWEEALVSALSSDICDQGEKIPMQAGKITVDEEEHIHASSVRPPVHPPKSQT